MKGVTVAAVIGLLACVSAVVSASGQPEEPQSKQLAAELAGPSSATQVLTKWCARLGLVDPPVIRAARETGVFEPASSDTRRRLLARPGDVIGYRRVRLMCGNRTLSQADNWYLPRRLTADMNRQLSQTDRPFGAVVAPLSFHRRTVAMTPLAGADGLLRVRAVLVSDDGVPFSLVVETYSRDLVPSTPLDR